MIGWTTSGLAFELRFCQPVPIIGSGVESMHLNAGVICLQQNMLVVRDQFNMELF